MPNSFRKHTIASNKRIAEDMLLRNMAVRTIDSYKQVPENLPGVEFTRRWSLHILPNGFTKSRCFGGYSSATRTAFIALCQRLHPPPIVDQAETQVSQAPCEEPSTRAERCCATCQQPMQLISETGRPSWRDLFYGPDHHAWFES